MNVRPLTDEERAVLELLCAGDWDGAETARSQLNFAMHAGPGHEGEDECFEIAVHGDVPLFDIERHTHVRSLLVHDGKEIFGEIELAVESGLISSFEFTVYGADVSNGLPTEANVTDNPMWRPA